MTGTVALTIDGHRLEVPAGTTLLDAAAQIGITIPTLCYHPTLTANGLCRICSVEVEGARTLVPSCVAKVAEGMVVHTESERVRRSRRTILEMLASAVDVSEAPEILVQMQRYNAEPNRFAGTERREIPLLDDNPFYVRDYSKCILCWRCVQVCAEDVQHTFALNLSGRGFATTIGTFYDAPMPETTCVFCGQCVGVCPTGALKPRREWLLEQGRSPDEFMGMGRRRRRRAAL
jgi:NADP-reducing hydrogenase subunit HndD